MIPVNLYADRLAIIAPVRTMDLYVQSQTPMNREAARKLGLTDREYQRFQQILEDDGAEYVVLPRHLTAMSGMHHGRVYVLKNVVLPKDTMGWAVSLSSTKTVFVPRVCGNLSILVTPVKPIAYHHQKPFHNFPVPHPYPIAAVIPTPAPVPIVLTPAPDVLVPPAIVTLPHSNWGFGVLAFPIAASLISQSSVPACSAGSNIMGVCTK